MNISQDRILTTGVGVLEQNFWTQVKDPCCDDGLVYHEIISNAKQPLLARGR